MRHYIKAGFEDAITTLPLNVQLWFEENYEKFAGDISYKNDEWPTFHITTHTGDEYGVPHAIILQLTGEDDGEEYPAGFRLSMCEMQSDGGFAWDGNDDVITEEAGRINSVNWDLMKFITNNHLIRDDEE